MVPDACACARTLQSQKNQDGRRLLAQSPCLFFDGKGKRSQRRATDGNFKNFEKTVDKGDAIVYYIFRRRARHSKRYGETSLGA